MDIRTAKKRIVQFRRSGITLKSPQMVTLDARGCVVYKKITAIVRESQFEGISAQLTAMGIGGLSVSRVKGYGEYQNEFSADGMVEHFKLEIWLEDKIAQSVVLAIMDQAHTGLEGDGIIAVENVPELYRIRTRSKIN